MPKMNGKPQEIAGSLNYDLNVQYLSVLVGPVIRANDWVSAFVLVGVAHQKFDNYIYIDAKVNNEKLSAHENSSNTSFAYALGMQFNVYKNFIIDTAWTRTESGNDNGFNVGIGYKF